MSFDVGERGVVTMSKPMIFTVTAAWDEEVKVWSGHCAAIPAPADAATHDGITTKISRMALDFAPDNHPDLAPESIFIQIVALRDATPLAA
jgi:hypothetical protein